MQVIFANNVGAGVRLNLGSPSDTFIAQGVLVASTDSVAVNGAGSYHNLSLAGTIAGEQGLDFGANPSGDHDNTVTIGASGSVFATLYGVILQGTNNTLINHGMISSSTGVGVSMTGTSPDSTSHLFNSGTIEGGHYGIYHSNGTETLFLTNTGLIQGLYNSYATLDGLSFFAVDHIRNRGEMIGDIDLGSGNDYYDGRGGLVEGTIYGGSENDTFITGLSDEVIDGGTGIDTLDFSKAGGIAVSLTGSFANTGTAAGDTYTNIENVTGSRFGRDTIAGDASDNTLDGRGGLDVLSGGDGNDRLIGGLGADKLTGGLGNDTFIYNTLAEAGDTISDFHGTLNDNDILWINAASFGGGLTLGLLKAGELISEVGHAAQAATDRFIYDTADTSLWFDVDGTGAKAAVLVADMQASATFNSLDIFFI